MSTSFALIAIKTRDIEKVLETVSNFYKEYNFELKEIGFNGNSSPYIDDVVYKTYEDYRNDREALIYKTGSMYSNNFGFYYGLKENKDWLVITYRHEASPYPLSLDINLTNKLCNTFDTEIVEYLVDEEHDIEIIRYRESDNIIDYSIRVSGNQNLAKGRLKEIEKIGTDSFFKDIGFNPFVEEIQDYRKPNQWRSFYLESTEENLINYLENIQNSV